MPRQRLLLAAAALVVILIVVGAVWQPWQSPPPPPTAATEEAAATGIDASPKALGDANAPVTIIEYASTSCPACANFHANVLPWLRETFIDSGRVRLEYRDFPTNAPALWGAMLAHCAGPERYFAFIETLFNTFDSWTRAADYLKALGQIGQLGGVSEAQFNDCLGGKSLEAKIFSVMLDARESYDVGSTPTFIINGNKHEGNMSFKTFSKTLDRYLPDI